MALGMVPGLMGYQLIQRILVRLIVVLAAKWGAADIPQRHPE